MHHKFDKQLWLTPISIIIGSLIIASSVYFNEPIRTGTQATKTSTSTTAPIKIRGIAQTDHVLGNPNAKVVLIEYSDTECPYCKTYHQTLHKIIEKYGKDVAWVYRHNPLPIHPKAQREAEATECAADQGGNEKFWQYIDRLFAITPSNNKLEDSELSKIASFVGLDVKVFNDCLNSGKFKNKILAEQKEVNEAGGSGTPFTVLMSKNENTPIRGAHPYESVENYIKTALGIK